MLHLAFLSIPEYILPMLYRVISLVVTHIFDLSSEERDLKTYRFLRLTSFEKKNRILPKKYAFTVGECAESVNI
jgi:hypothetical protein